MERLAMLIPTPRSPARVTTRLTTRRILGANDGPVAVGPSVDRWEPPVSYTNAMSTTRARRLIVVLAVLGALVRATGAPAAPLPAPAPADWTTAGGTLATGSLVGTPVQLSGNHVFGADQGSAIDGNAPYFNGSDFSPALAKSDAIQIGGRTGYSYTIHFDDPITNPVLEVGSLASQLTFRGISSVTQLSGARDFHASGTTVTGAYSPDLGAEGIRDNSGTIRINGTYRTIVFDTTYSGPQDDGILLQLVLPTQFTDWTSATARPSAASGSLLGARVDLAGGNIFAVPGSRVDESWPYFNGPDFLPALASSDVIEIGGRTGYVYTIDFHQWISNPVVHLGSLASQVDFPGVQGLRRVSGARGFRLVGPTSVAGDVNTLDSGPESVWDSSGTVRILGSYQTLKFQTTYNGPSDDGILLQVGAVTP
jgi:hypothetical protein